MRPRYRNQRRNGSTVWEWRCDCGSTVFKALSLVRDGMSTMCPTCARALKQQQASAMAAAQQRATETNMMQGALDSLREGKPQRHNTSGVRGVSWHTAMGKWQVRVQEHGKTRTIGYYASIEEAAQARAEAVKKRYGKRRNE